MTTPLKASRFNIRRPEGAAAPVTAVPPRAPVPPAQAADMPFATHDDGFGDMAFPGSARAEAEAMQPVPAAAAAPTPAEEAALDAIRKEGLTGRQLRVARRLAQRHNLPATSDYDAVRLLRAAGVDPFQRSSMLELVAADPTQPAPAADPAAEPAAPTGAP
ncbi:MAG: hypothetical protein R3D63_07090 [Paracoccaceae bacterium]